VAGPPAKSADRRARRNVDAVTAVVAPIAERPDPPRGLSPGGRDEWEAFWASPLAKTVCATDLPALRRLFELREEAAEAHEAYQLAPTIEGSMGQPVTNPEGRHALAIDAAVVALEDRFGLNPKARLGMGVRMGQAADAAQRHPGLLTPEPSPRADPRLPNSKAAPAHRRPGGGGLDGGKPPPR
jgi:hypothetical protein